MTFAKTLLLLLGLALVGSPALAQDDVRDFDFEGDVIEVDSYDHATRVGLLQGRIDQYLDLSRQSAREGLANAYDDFAIWFPAYNEREADINAALWTILLRAGISAVSAGMVSGDFQTLAKTGLKSAGSELGSRSGTTLFGNSQDFLVHFKKAYNEWVLSKGLDVYKSFRKDDLHKQAVYLYMEDWDQKVLESDGVEDDLALESIMSSLGVPAPGVATQRKFHECGLFLLVRRTVEQSPHVTSGEREWEFLGLDLDTYVRIEQIDRYIDWISPYAICRDWSDAIAEIE